MRSNGLTAPSYAPVADVDPQVAHVLLGELRQRGVAAYSKPVEGNGTAALGVAEYRVAVKERLYVDAVAATDVRDLIIRSAPTSDVDNEDLRWEQIVARFEETDVPPVPRWPDAEEVAAEAADDAADDFFIPAEPPPLPRLAPYQQLAWIGLAGGPLLLLIAALFAVTLPVWLSLAAVGGFVGGFLVLVATMEDRRPPDEESGNGAVV
jgi:hypothetical protein